MEVWRDHYSSRVQPTSHSALCRQSLILPLTKNICLFPCNPPYRVFFLHQAEEGQTIGLEAPVVVRYSRYSDLSSGIYQSRSFSTRSVVRPHEYSSAGSLPTVYVPACIGTISVQSEWLGLAEAAGIGTVCVAREHAVDAGYSPKRWEPECHKPQGSR